MRRSCRGLRGGTRPACPDVRGCGGDAACAGRRAAGGGPTRIGILRKPNGQVAAAGGAFVGMSGYGASGAEADLWRHFGITPEAVRDAARGLLGRG